MTECVAVLLVHNRECRALLVGRGNMGSGKVSLSLPQAYVQVLTRKFGSDIGRSESCSYKGWPSPGLITDSIRCYSTGLADTGCSLVDV
jgi:uncharacterized protein YejL (UPF0352 family)